MDPKKVDMFMRFKETPAEDDRKVFTRPRPGQWKQMVESSVYKNGNTLREYQVGREGDWEMRGRNYLDISKF